MKDGRLYLYSSTIAKRNWSVALSCFAECVCCVDRVPFVFKLFRCPRSVPVFHPKDRAAIVSLLLACESADRRELRDTTET